MHIPDGFLDLSTAASTYAVSAAGVGIGLRQVGKKLGERQVPVMGVMGAFIFAAQMLNFPIAGGTSGHLIGAALAAVLLGPWAAAIVMSCVLTIQSLLFQDGGLGALGANVLNMALVAPFVAYFFYRAIRWLVPGQKAAFWAAFVGAWTSVVAASSLCALELAVSGTSSAKVALPAMIGIHALIGLGEGAVTVAVLSVVAATRRELLEPQRASA
jgi:cobalt/nickel transport system permease protein